MAPATSIAFILSRHRAKERWKSKGSEWVPLQDASLNSSVMRSFCMVDEEVQAVEEIHLTDSRIGIEKDQVELGISLLHAFLHSFGDYVVSNASERL